MTNSEATGERGRKRSRRLLGRAVLWAGLLLCVPGGVLWALSPLGVSISEMRYNTPNVFWKFFSSAPLLILVGLLALYFGFPARYKPLLRRLAFFVTLLGFLLVVAGNVGQFWLRVDDVYIMTAPAYYTFRVGLLMAGAGTMFFGVASEDSVVPTWGALPLALGGLCGLIAFSRDLGAFGAGLWVLFGVGWAWAGIAAGVRALSSLRREGRAAG